MENYNNITTLHQLLDYDIRKFIAAEAHLVQGIEEWANKSGNLQLKTVLYKYIDFVKQHQKILATLMDEEAISTCSTSDRIMKACIEDTEEKMRCCADAEVRDASLLAGMQVINHFKISAFGSAAAFAKTLNMQKAATAFHEMESNEKQIDERLSHLAEEEINKRARTPFTIPK